MSVLPIVQWPDARLSQVCDTVPAGEDVALLAHDMLETMYAAPGRGLAGPQVGVMQRIFVMDCSWKEGVLAPEICINPIILHTAEESEMGIEGCLSIPDVPVEVKRPTSVVMQWQDLNGVLVVRNLSGFEARCAQHELDHLNGVVIFDHLAPDQRAALETPYLEALV